MRHHVSVTVLGFMLAASVASAEPAGRVYEVAPEDDYRITLRQLQPGDELRFLPGVHEGHAVIRAAGEPERPITIRGVVEDGERPELRFTGRGHNLWRIRGDHLHIRDLSFHATHAYGIRVDRADDITIENCVFRDCGGGDISANTANVDRLHIRGCRFIGSRRTPVYIGQHDGELDIDDFRFERNLIDGRRIEGGIGYGIQLKLNVRGGMIRDNIVFGTRGPGIMVYGAEGAQEGGQSLIERNLVVGSRRHPGIAVGGGPAVVRHNITIAGHGDGIGVFDYGGRGMLEQITLEGNLSALNRGHDLSIRGRIRDLTAMDNRIYHRPGGSGIRGLRASGQVSGNESTGAGSALREVVEQVEDAVPDEAAVERWIDRMNETVPDDEAALVELLQLLLEDADGD